MFATRVILCRLLHFIFQLIVINHNCEAVTSVKDQLYNKKQTGATPSSQYMQYAISILPGPRPPSFCVLCASRCLSQVSCLSFSCKNQGSVWCETYKFIASGSMLMAAIGSDYYIAMVCTFLAYFILPSATNRYIAYPLYQYDDYISRFLMKRTFI